MNNINITIKYLKRAKRLTLRVLPNLQVQLTAPVRSKKSDIELMIEKHKDWILKKQQLLSLQPAPQKFKFITGEKIPVLGSAVILKIIDGKGLANEVNGELCVPVPINISESDMQAREFIQRQVIRWLKEKAIVEIENQAAKYCNLLGVKAKHICIKNYKARWGACSSKAELMFNWQIITFDRHLFDYVVAHEVCHLKEMNHSPRFYFWLSQLGFDRKQLRPLMKNQRNIF